MVSHHSSKMGSHCNFSSGDIILGVVEEKDFRYSRENLFLLFFLKGHYLKEHGILF